MWRERSVNVVFPAHNEEEKILDAVAGFSSPGCVDESVGHSVILPHSRVPSGAPVPQTILAPHDALPVAAAR